MAPEPAVRRVLVVDDQEPNVRLLERILSGAGHHVRGVTDARLVVENVETFQPDLVMLDLRMPHIDGFALLEELKANDGPDEYLPMVVLTADADPATRHRALSLGANDFLTKPFDATEVLLRARNLLATRDLYRALHASNQQQANEIVAMASGIDEAQRTRRDIIATLAHLPTQTLSGRAKSLLVELCRDGAIDAAFLVALDNDAAATLLAAHGIARFERDGEWPMPSGEAVAMHALAGAPVAYRPIEMQQSAVMTSILGGTGTRLVGHVSLGSEADPLAVLVVATDGSIEPGTAPQSLPGLSELGATATLLLGDGLRERATRLSARTEIETIIDTAAFCPLFQPIVDMRTRSVVGYEALTRFSDATRPDERFAAADRLGMGLRLEEATLFAAVSEARDLPPTAFLSLNTSPELLLSHGRLARVVIDAQRLIVVEITEHVEIADYPSLRSAIESLGPQVRIAIDDAGAGFASFRHVLELRPDFVKLDAQLVRGIEADASRQALVVGMRYFAQQTGTTLIAEGVETEAERAMLEGLGVSFGQGYLFARPERSLAIAS